MLFMVYPQMIPGKGQPVGGSEGGRSSGVGVGLSSGLGSGIGIGSAAREGPAVGMGVGNVSTASVAIKAERYEPRLFGFRVNEEAKLARWRSATRDAQIARLEALDKDQTQPNL